MCFLSVAPIETRATTPSVTARSPTTTCGSKSSRAIASETIPRKERRRRGGNYFRLGEGPGSTGTRSLVRRSAISEERGRRGVTYVGNSRGIRRTRSFPPTPRLSLIDRRHFPPEYLPFVSVRFSRHRRRNSRYRLDERIQYSASVDRREGCLKRRATRLFAREETANESRKLRSPGWKFAFRHSPGKRKLLISGIFKEGTRTSENRAVNSIADLTNFDLRLIDTQGHLSYSFRNSR